MNYRIPIPQVEEFLPERYPCYRVKEKHILDGNLDKSFWANAPFTNEFVDIRGSIGPKPRFQTRAKILWDDDALYFGAELLGDEIWATVTKHDDVIFMDNDFEIFIDPDNDTHNYCEFEVNALNTTWDLLLTRSYRDGGLPINSFDMKGLKSAVKVVGDVNNPNAENKKWSVEVVIPLTSIIECNGKEQKRPKVGDFWRFNFSRVHWAVDVVDGKYQKRMDENGKPLPEDNWVWSPMGLVNMHYPELWGYVFFCDREESCPDLPQDENLKWEMRKIYYQLHACYDEHGFFNRELVKNSISAEIYTTKNSFEIISPASKGGFWVLHSNSELLYKR
ncbi:carbohydrate-binding family 9-like protein [Scatolibacter rhodanostii]|uniref:carbohydrate-binding family 9-like protein n=1 Tax=Scatolibacter rhodanostii TaxID=2014781 RepID=UPI000C081C64|nr:carbohydrate-binding family 9-like protein [Scatolibacter rhodanostii]